MDKDFEAGSVLKEGDYKKPSNRLLMVLVGLCILALLAFFVPLLN
jgi:hypothetical protein